MSDGYERWGCQDTWGAQTHPMGYRGDMVRQKARETIASLGNLLTPFEWVAPPSSRLQAHARARG
jgi:hypothetical protein